MLSPRLTRIEKRQRFYARNAVNTTLARCCGPLMSSFWVNHQANPAVSNGIQPSQTNFADEVCAMVARIFLYVGTLALFGILGVHVWNKYRDPRLAESAARVWSSTEWSVADRSRPAFSVSQADQG